MDNHVKNRIFIRYTATYSQIYYWDMDTNMVNNSKHIRFDEEMNDIEMTTTNVRQLHIFLNRTM